MEQAQDTRSLCVVVNMVKLLRNILSGILIYIKEDRMAEELTEYSILRHLKFYQKSLPSTESMHIVMDCSFV